MASVDYLVLADYATAAEGKLYIHGAGWDAIFAPSFPHTQPVMGAGMRFRIPWAETNTPWKIEIDAVDEDGTSILPAPITAELNTGRPTILKPGSDQVVPLAAQINGLQFSRPGTYAIVLRVDGEETARSPFNVMPLPLTNLR